MSDCEIPRMPEEAPPTDPDNSVPSVRRLQVVADPDDSAAVTSSMLRLAGQGFRRRAEDALRIDIDPGDTPPPAA